MGACLSPAGGDAVAPAAAPVFAYVGSRTTRERQARGEGISVYRLDPMSGRLDLVQVVGDLVNPSFLALNRAGDRLYAVHGDRCEASAFAVAADGRLERLGTRSTDGLNPVHLALAPDGRHLVVSNHIGASLAVLPIDAAGRLAPVSQLVALEGVPGPHRVEQKQAKPHANPFDPGGRFVVVPDKGLDRLFTFTFEDGRLVRAGDVAAREGAGPRHLAFHPRQPWAYCVNELDSTVTMYAVDAATGRLAPLQVLSALPDDFVGNSRAAEIEVDPAGRYVYASTRGADRIAVFAVDGATGRLRFVAAEPAGGRTPRFITVAPGGRYLYALNEDSDTIVPFAVDAGTGRLTPAGEPIRCGSPVCMVFRTRPVVMA